MSPELRAELLAVLHDASRELDKHAQGIFGGSYWSIELGRRVNALLEKLAKEQA